MRVALESFLHQQRQRVHAAPHVGVASRNSHPHARSNGDHHRCPSASAATAAFSIAASTVPVIRIRAPAANSISIAPLLAGPTGPGVLEKLGGWNPDRQLICDEHELYMRAIQAGGHFQFAPTANAVYRIWSDETRSRATPSLLISQKSRLIVEMREWLLHRNLWTVEHEAIAGRACLEMCRTLARYDLSTANRRFQQFKRMNLIALSGPAAPKRYRGAYKIVGFMGAELAARGLRSINGR